MNIPGAMLEPKGMLTLPAAAAVQARITTSSIRACSTAADGPVGMNPFSGKLVGTHSDSAYILRTENGEVR